MVSVKISQVASRDQDKSLLLPQSEASNAYGRAPALGCQSLVSKIPSILNGDFITSFLCAERSNPDYSVQGGKRPADGSERILL